MLGDLLVDLLRAFLAADGFPKRRTIVEVVRNNGAVLLGLLNALDDESRRGVAKRRKNAAGVKPADALLAENVFQSLLSVTRSVVFPCLGSGNFTNPSRQLTTVYPLNWLLLP